MANLGREVSPLEHDIEGTAWVGRDNQTGIKLPPDLERAQQEAHLRISQLKREWRDDAGRIAIIMAEGLPVIEDHTNPSLENFRLQ